MRVSERVGDVLRHQIDCKYVLWKDRDHTQDMLLQD